jgi:hypothetical protein
MTEDADSVVCDVLGAATKAALLLRVLGLAGVVGVGSGRGDERSLARRSRRLTGECRIEDETCAAYILVQKPTPRV